MKKKFTILLLSCVFCVAMISIGVFAVSYLKLNVAGTIDFISYDKLVYVEQVEIKNFVDSTDGGESYDTKSKVIESFNGKYLKSSSSVASIDISNIKAMHGEWLTIEITFVSLYEKDLWVECKYNNLEALTISTNSVKLRKNTNGDIASGDKKVFCISIKNNNAGAVSLQDVAIDISFVEVPEIDANGIVTNLTDPRYTAVKYNIDENKGIGFALANSAVTSSEIVIMGEVIKNGVLYPVVTISERGFYNATNLISVVVMEGVERADYYCFSGCTNLANIVLAGSVEQIAEQAFFACSSLKSVVLSNCVNYISSNAFYNCSNLKYVTKGNQAPEFLSNASGIGGYAFLGCSNLEYVEIPDSIVELQSLAFSGLAKLTTVKMSNNVTTMGSQAFSSCPKLSDVTLSAGLTTIEGSVFKNCSSLKSIVLPEGLTEISDYMFYNSGIESIVLPKTITSIGIFAFLECYDLMQVVLNEGLATIGGSAFESCGLTTLTIPSTVTSIGSYAFAWCSDLTSITIKAQTPPTLEDNTVFEDTNNCPIYLPAGTESTYSATENWSGYSSRFA